MLGSLLRGRARVGVCDAWVSGRRVEAGLVGLADPHGLFKRVVDFEDDALSAVLGVDLSVSIPAVASDSQARRA
ncbi:MAG: hypothetical protein A2V77_01760 [Anaeromyxobacter sp. RBG_16_69_14]|nr:MAG: hypothetical protein A2V77_01760 [Anaeromyxobacter sp. RBG_16_69_14]